MAWRLSTQLQKDLLAGQITVTKNVISNDINFTTNAIQAGTAILGDFKPNDFILVIGSATNNGVMARVMTAADTELTFAAGAFTAEATSDYVTLIAFKNGSVKDLFKNSVLVLFTEVRPDSADYAETGTKLCELTKDGNAFVPGSPENGINLRAVVDGGEVSLKRAMELTDPTLPETIQGNGIATGTAGWGRWYINDMITGASSVASRMDGVVTTSGGDIVMANGRDVAIGAPVTVTDISVKIQGV